MAVGDDNHTPLTPEPRGQDRGCAGVMHMHYVGQSEHLRRAPVFDRSGGFMRIQIVKGVGDAPAVRLEGAQQSK